MAFLACTAVSSAALANWTMFQKDSLHSGTTLQDGAESDIWAWEQDTKPQGWNDGDVIWGSPVINSAATRVYIGTRAGRLWCFDLAEGDTIWTHQLPGAVTGTPALANGRLYVLAQGDRSLYCLDAADGDSLWSTELGGVWIYGGTGADWVESSAVVVGDSVFVGSRDGRVYSLDADDGSTNWVSDILGDYITSSPAVSGGHVFVGVSFFGADSCGVYALDIDDGSIYWRYKDAAGNPGGTMSSPMVRNGRVFIGMNNRWDPPNIGGGSIACFTEERPDPPYEKVPAWTYGIDCDVRGTPVQVGNLVYVTSGKGLYAFVDSTGTLVYGQGHNCGVILGTGEETWSSFGVSARFTVAEQETLLFVGDGGYDSGGGIFCLDPDLNVDPLWSYQTGRTWGSPAIAAGRVVIGGNDGWVRCFIDDPQQGRIISPDGSIAYIRGDRRTPAPPSGVEPAARMDRWQVRVQPNPVRDVAVIQYRLPLDADARVELAVTDASGRLVRRLAGTQPVGQLGTVEWDRRGENGVRVASGVYLVHLTAGRMQWSDRIVVGP